MSGRVLDTPALMSVMQTAEGWKLLDRPLCRFAPNRFSSSEVDELSGLDAGGSARKSASHPATRKPRVSGAPASPRE